MFLIRPWKINNDEYRECIELPKWGRRAEEAVFYAENNNETSTISSMNKWKEFFLYAILARLIPIWIASAQHFVQQ